MAEPSEPRVRPPVFAGQFYPADPAQCRETAQSYLAGAPKPAADGPRWLGGIVPHAGWICSGAIAGQTIATLAAAAPHVDVVVVFGAVHTPVRFTRAALDPHQRWLVPGGGSDLPEELSRQLAELPDHFAVEERLHAREHAVEVELPLIQLAWPAATVLPIEVPVTPDALAVGRETVQRITAAGLTAVYLASSDLTHYGPNYGFTPAGIGPAALQWAMDNDRRLLSAVANLAAERVVPEVGSRNNACGGGAIAAMLSACRELGATRGAVLRHTNSYDVLRDVAPQPPDNAVGYAAVVVG